MPKQKTSTTSRLSSQDFIAVVTFGTIPCPLTIDEVEELLEVIQCV
jgi:hypothetical protein